MLPLHALAAAKDDPREWVKYFQLKAGFVYVSNGVSVIRIKSLAVFGDIDFAGDEELAFDKVAWKNSNIHKAVSIRRDGSFFEGLDAKGRVVGTVKASTEKVDFPDFEKGLMTEPAQFSIGVDFNYAGMIAETLRWPGFCVQGADMTGNRQQRLRLIPVGDGSDTLRAAEVEIVLGNRVIDDNLHLAAPRLAADDQGYQEFLSVVTTPAGTLTYTAESDELEEVMKKIGEVLKTMSVAEVLDNLEALELLA